MSAALARSGERAFGPVVEGEALVSSEGFSPRYDLDRWTGVITKPGHKLEGVNIRDKMLFFPTAKGGIAAGWAFYDIKAKRHRAQGVRLRRHQPGDGAGRGVRRHPDHRRLEPASAHASQTG